MVLHKMTVTLGDGRMVEVERCPVTDELTATGVVAAATEAQLDYAKQTFVGVELFLMSAEGEETALRR